jgi:hypothetical protein
MSECDDIKCVRCGELLWPSEHQRIEPKANADGCDVTLTCPSCGQVNTLADWSGPASARDERGRRARNETRQAVCDGLELAIAAMVGAAGAWRQAATGARAVGAEELAIQAESRACECETGAERLRSSLREHRER